MVKNDKAIMENMTPAGRQLGVVNVGKQSSMFRIDYIDGIPGGMPARYAGTYTSRAVAQQELTQMLIEMWSLGGEKQRKTA